MNEQTLFEPLSRREREILALLGENLSNREIAERLFVALHTVKWYNRQIYNKLGVENRHGAVKRASALGLLAQNDAAGSTPAKHNLPSQLTPFVGRSYELAKIDGWLAQPHTRLLTILAAPDGMEIGPLKRAGLLRPWLCPRSFRPTLNQEQDTV